MRRFKFRASLLALALPALLLSAGAASAVNTGSADFTRYVAVGDSLTAGFTSDSLIDFSQRASYPALIAKSAGVSDFELPLVSPPGIPPIFRLIHLLPTPLIGPSPGLGAPENLNLPRPYNDLAVPGENVHTMINTVTDHGGLHDLILRGLGTQLQQAVGSHPTFLTVWIGNNDALTAATGGGLATLTPLDSFTADYQTIIGALASTGAKMAIANIPNVTTIPFVTTIPPVVVNPATRQPVLVGGAPVPLIGPNGPLSQGDHVLLPASGLLAQGIGIPQALGGTGLPLPAQVVLTAGDAGVINQRIGQFNSVIQAAANQVGAAYVDVNGFLNQLAAQGIAVGGLTFTPAFLTGGVFSYDGVHPTAFGYAYVANVFINSINAKFGGQIPLTNLGAGLFDSTAPGVRGEQAMPEMTPAALRNLYWSMGWPELVLSPGVEPPAPPRHRNHH